MKEGAMFETLAGRLKWERTDHGIRVEYRMRGDYSAMWEFFKGGWRNDLPALLFLAAIFLVADFLARHRHTAGWWSARWWADPLSLLIGTMLGRLLSILANRTILTLDPTKLELEFRRWNWKRGRETYLTTHLHDLRFAKSTRGAETQNGLRLNEIQFDDYLATQYFATGITQEEATALIAKMMEVYPFPKYTAADAPTDKEEASIHA
jgi:hypothetical protein